MWKCHYKSLLNSVQNDEFKNSVKSNINQQHPNYIIITPFNVVDALKNIKCGKSGGVDGISAEHFVFAHNRTQVLLSLYFLHLLLKLLTRYVHENSLFVTYVLCQFS